MGTYPNLVAVIPYFSKTLIMRVPTRVFWESSLSHARLAG